MAISDKLKEVYELKKAFVDVLSPYDESITLDSPFSSFVSVIDSETTSTDTSESANKYINKTLEKAESPLVTSIGMYQFDGFTELYSVNFPNAVRLGDYCFNNCSRLYSADFGDYTYIGTNAFCNCSNLRKLWIPKSCTSISAGAGVSTTAPFYGCSTTLTVYTPYASRPSGWWFNWDGVNFSNYDTVASRLKVVWNATYEQYLNA